MSTVKEMTVKEMQEQATLNQLNLAVRDLIRLMKIVSKSFNAGLLIWK